MPRALFVGFPTRNDKRQCREILVNTVDIDADIILTILKLKQTILLEVQ